MMNEIKMLKSLSKLDIEKTHNKLMENQLRFSRELSKFGETDIYE